MQGARSHILRLLHRRSLWPAPGEDDSATDSDRDSVLPFLTAASIQGPRDPFRRAVFRKAAEFAGADVEALVETIRSRVLRLLRSHGSLTTEGEMTLSGDPEEQGLLPLFQAASIQGRVAQGPDAGARVGGCDRRTRRLPLRIAGIRAVSRIPEASPAPGPAPCACDTVLSRNDAWGGRDGTKQVRQSLAVCPRAEERAERARPSSGRRRRTPWSEAGLYCPRTLPFRCVCLFTPKPSRGGACSLPTLAIEATRFLILGIPADPACSATPEKGETLG